MRRAAKRDENEPAIIEALRERGCTVFRMNQEGILDLIVYYRGFQCFLEVKMAGANKKSRDDKRTPMYRPPRMTMSRISLLSPSQRNFVCSWPGPWQIVMNFEEAWVFIHENVHGAGWHEDAADRLAQEAKRTEVPVEVSGG